MFNSSVGHCLYRRFLDTTQSRSGRAEMRENYRKSLAKACSFVFGTLNSVAVCIGY